MPVAIASALMFGDLCVCGRVRLHVAAAWALHATVLRCRVAARLLCRSSRSAKDTDVAPPGPFDCGTGRHTHTCTHTCACACEQGQTLTWGRGVVVTYLIPNQMLAVRFRPTSVFSPTVLHLCVLPTATLLCAKTNTVDNTGNTQPTQQARSTAQSPTQHAQQRPPLPCSAARRPMHASSSSSAERSCCHMPASSSAPLPCAGAHRAVVASTRAQHQVCLVWSCVVCLLSMRAWRSR